MHRAYNPDVENNHDCSDSDPIDDKNYNRPTLQSLYFDNIKSQALICGFFISGGPFIGGFLAGSVATFPILMAAGICNNKELFIVPGCIAGSILGIPTFAIGSTIGATFIAPFTTIAAYFRNFQSDTEIESVKNLLALTDTLDRQQIIDIINDKYHASLFQSYESLKLMHDLQDVNHIATYTLEEKWQRLTAYMTDKTYTNAYTNNGKNLFNLILEIARSNETAYRIKLQHILHDKKEKLKQIDFDFLMKFDEKGMNYLHRAVINNNITVIQTLKKTKMLNTLTQHKKYIKPVTALYIAVDLGRTSIAIELINANATFNDDLISLAIKKNRLDILKLLHAKQSRTLQDIVVDKKGRNILHLAAKYGHIDIVQYLIDSGMDINATTYSANGTGKTASQLAEKYDHAYVAKAIDLGMDNIRNELKILFNMVNDSVWDNRGFQLFAPSKKPDGIEWILELMHKIHHSSDIDNIKDSGVLNIAIQLWEYYFGLGMWRNKETRGIYAFANNVGNNKGLPNQPTRDVYETLNLNH